MYTVVLAVDTGAELAREAATAVADLPEAPEAVDVYVHHCFTENPTGASATQVTGVRAAVDVLEDADVSYRVTEDSGDPAETIRRQAAAVDADCIAIGGRKRSPAGKALFGSVTQSVVLDADRPVLVAGEMES